MEAKDQLRFGSARDCEIYNLGGQQSRRDGSRNLVGMLDAR